MEIRVADTPAVLRDWMELPWRIYRNDPNWIPHLKQDVAKVFDRTPLVADLQPG